MGNAKPLKIILYSFGFKYGTPVDVNLLWDVRFLPNPYWEEKLRPETGKVKEVADYVLKSEAGETFLNHLEPLLQFLVKQNSIAAKSTIRIAVGCTGGRHRSVAVTEKISVLLSELSVDLTVFHRDIEKDGRDTG